MKSESVGQYLLSFGIVLPVSFITINWLGYFFMFFIVTINLFLFPGAPSDLTPWVLPLFVNGTLFVVAYLITRSIYKTQGINYLLVFLFSLISLTAVNIIEIVLCSMSFFCTHQTIQETIVLIIIQLAIVMVAALFTKYYNKSIIWLIIIYCLVLGVILYGSLKIQDVQIKNKLFMYTNSFSSGQFEKFSIPSIPLSFSIPKDFSQTKTYGVITVETDKYMKVMNKYPDFKTIYELSFGEEIAKMVGTRYKYSILIPNDPSVYTSDKAFLNTCSFDVFNDEYEICDGDKSFKQVNDQINYCKAYSPRLRKFDAMDAEKASKTQELKRGNFTFENTLNTYIAKPLHGYDYCFVLTVSVSNDETRYTNPATIDAFANYVMKSLSR